MNKEKQEKQAIVSSVCNCDYCTYLREGTPVEKPKTVQEVIEHVSKILSDRMKDTI